MPFPPRSSRPDAGHPSATRRGEKRLPAAQTTHHESLWYSRHVDQATPLLIRLRDGEELQGVLEWYDRGAYRVGMKDGGHLVVQKSAVQSLRKAPGASSRGGAQPSGDGEAGET